MSRIEASQDDAQQPDAAAAGVDRSRSMMVITPQPRRQAFCARCKALRLRLLDQVQRAPLAYKLSFSITVLVVSCMTLLGVILIQQQTAQMQEQISEQGYTLVQLMAESAKEPLLAEDELALDTITSGFSNNGSVLGAAITSLEGEIITRGGVLYEENNLLTRKAVQQLVKSSVESSTWEWQPLTGQKPQTVISFIQPVVFQDVTAGHALVTYSQAALTQTKRRAVQAITGATLMIIALSIAMAFAMGRRITQPIDKLVDASRAIGSGEYTFRFKERRKDELGLLMEAFNEMAEGMLERTQVKSALSRYVSPGVARQILSNLDNVALSGKRIEGSVLFADISGFTKISEQTRAEELVSMLNRYFSLITCACVMNNGIVDKYMGDGVMLVFGAPEADKDHAFHAISCALLIQKLIAHENNQREADGLFPVQFRIGINTGSMLAGNMGSHQRMEYTVVGDTVNLASRLCGIANSSEIIISREMYSRDDVTGRVLAGEFQSIRLRGISQPVNTYLVECLTADYQEIIDNQFDEILRSETAGDCDA
jgi:adenylate cyclase